MQALVLDNVLSAQMRHGLKVLPSYLHGAHDLIGIKDLEAILKCLHGPPEASLNSLPWFVNFLKISLVIGN